MSDKSVHFKTCMQAQATTGMAALFSLLPFCPAGRLLPLLTAQTCNQFALCNFQSIPGIQPKKIDRLRPGRLDERMGFSPSATRLGYAFFPFDLLSISLSFRHKVVRLMPNTRAVSAFEY